MEAKNAEWAKIFVACLQVFIYFLNSSFTLNKVKSPPMWCGGQYSIDKKVLSWISLIDV